MTGTTEKKQSVLIVVSLIVVILISRLLCLSHNIAQHPDENVFYYSTESLANFLLGREDHFTEVSEYPEGAYVFQLPFYLFNAILEATTGKSLYLPTIGRYASVFYFCLGAVLGLQIVRKFLNRELPAQIIYALIMAFSLLHIEQSRYGTGDAITLFLLMLLVFLTATSLRQEEKHSYVLLILAGLAAGALCAVKYPLLFFASIPLYGSFVYVREKRKKRFWLVLLQVVFLFLGFILFSPKAARDFGYPIRAIEREMQAYLFTGGYVEAGGPWNHIVSLFLYLSFYSGFPLATVLIASSVRRTKKEKKTEEYLWNFFYRFLPVLILVFFAYNLFAAMLFMRTYYPFYALTDLYIASEAGRWIASGKWRKKCIVVLSAILILRGVGFIGALSENDIVTQFGNKVEEAKDERWTHTTLLGPGYYLRFIHYYDSIVYQNLDEDRYLSEEGMRLEPGEMIITATQDHSRCSHYLFPIQDEYAKFLIEQWDQFKDINKEYYKGQAYPEYYYLLFGYWIRGTTGTDYEFLSNRIYYRSE